MLTMVLCVVLCLFLFHCKLYKQWITHWCSCEISPSPHRISVVLMSLLYLKADFGQVKHTKRAKQPVKLISALLSLTVPKYLSFVLLLKWNTGILPGGWRGRKTSSNIFSYSWLCRHSRGRAWCFLGIWFV